MTAHVLKPVPVERKPILDYHACAHYIEKKYDVRLRNWSKKFYDNPNKEDRPYQDFWHWIVENNPHLTNGSEIRFCIKRDHFDDKLWCKPSEDKMWILDVLDLWDKEFGEYVEDYEGLLEFWVEW